MAILHLMLGRTASNQIQQQVTVHSWSAAWCVVAQVVNICRGIQYTTSSPHITVLCTQLQTAMIMWLALCAVRVCYGLRDETVPRRLWQVLLTVSTLGSVTALWPGVVGGDQVYLWSDWLGQRFLKTETTPWIFIYITPSILLYLHCLRLLWRAKSMTVSERRMAVSALAIYLVLIISDVIVVTTRQRGILVWEYGNLLLTLIFDTLTLRLFRRLYRTLTTQVQAHTLQLTEKNAALMRSVDEARSADRAKSAFLANMSHEIRTPLNAVIGYTSLLLDAPLAKEHLEYVQAVRTAADALLSQLNNILDLSKVEADRLELETVSTDVRLAMEDAVEILAESARQKRLQLVCLLDRSCATHIMTDPGRLRQVLINLVGNAVKFAEHGEILVRGMAVPNATPPRLRIAVSDHGPGIPPDALSSLFQPFSQVDASIVRRHTGTGLGLALCKRLIEAMGGSIGVISKLGSGSTFWFELPMVTSEVSAATDMLPAASMGAVVLVIDECEPVREQLDQLLRKVSLESKLTQTIEEAIRALSTPNERTPSAILLSDSIPIEEIRKFAIFLRNSPRHQTVPMALLSATRKQHDRLSPILPSLMGELLKPIRLRRLLRLLHQIFGGNASSGQRHKLPRQERTSAHGFKTGESPPRVLVAEDNRASQRLAVLMLERLGCRVDVVANGNEAVQAARRFQYDLILMDCQMPELDGLSATREIRGLSHPMGTVPIIALTANAFREDEERSLAAGMNDFLTKPVTVDTLMRLLYRWLPRHFSSSDGSATVKAPPSPSVDAPNQGVGMEAELDSIRGKLVELAGIIGEDSAQQLTAVFHSESESSIAAAQGQLQAAAMDDLRKTAHRLAGGALGIGANGLAQLCRQLEESARKGDQEGAAEILFRVTNHTHRIRTGL